MRVLLDENVDRLLKERFDPEFTVLDVREHGWAGKTNGDLLRAAQREFDALITMDRNLEYQQNIRVLDLGIVVLRARSNAFSVVAPLMAEVNEVLRRIRPGEAVHVPR